MENKTISIIIKCGENSTLGETLWNEYCETYGQHFAIFGNNDYIFRYEDDFEHVIKCASDILYDRENNHYTLKDIASYYRIADKKGRFTKHMLNLLEKWENKRDREALCEFMTIITGNEWNYRCIRGYSQSDWNYCFYDNTIDVDYIEAIYFGRYDEIGVCEGEVNEEEADIDYYDIILEHSNPEEYVKDHYGNDYECVVYKEKSYIAYRLERQ